MRLQLLIDEHIQLDLLDQLLTILIDSLGVHHGLDEIIQEGKKLCEVEDYAISAWHSLYEVVLIEEWRSDGD